jgi:hypothetical protein
MLQNKKVIVGVGYRPPTPSRQDIDTFLEQFRHSLNSVLTLGAESVILLGDFNDRCTVWDSTHDLSQLGNDFYDLLNFFDMTQLVTECTYFTSHSESLIDLVLTDSPGYVQSVDLLPPLGSHHLTQYVEFKITHPRDKCYQRQVWDYSKGNYELLNNAISRYPWKDILLAEEDIDIVTPNWTNAFLDLCKENIPNREIRVRPKDLPWMNNKIKHLIRDRNRWYKKLRRTKSPNDEVTWKNKAREVRAEINLSRLRYRENLKKTLNDPCLAPKKYWSLVKRIYGDKKGMGIPVIEMGGKQLTTSQDKALAFTDFFKGHQTLIEPVGHLLPDIRMLTMERLSVVKTTPGEVYDILKGLEIGKSHGADGVSARLLKETSHNISEPLSALINMSFDKAQVPTSWKEANVSPVHKKNCRSSIENYRPISLLSILSKVQERIVYRRLYRYLAENNLLTDKNLWIQRT